MLIWPALICLSDFFVIYVCDGLTGDTERDKGRPGWGPGLGRQENKDCTSQCSTHTEHIRTYTRTFLHPSVSALIHTSIHFPSAVATEDQSMVSGKDQVFRCPWGSKGASLGRKVHTPLSEHYPSRPGEPLCPESPLSSCYPSPSLSLGDTTKHRQEWG